MKVDLGLKDGEVYSAETLAKIRKYLGVDDVVIGSYSPLAGRRNPAGLDPSGCQDRSDRHLVLRKRQRRPNG